MPSAFFCYYVGCRCTPALHTPLIAVTEAISSVIIVVALISADPADFNFSQAMGFLAVVLASVNIFGGFIVTQRMLSMFKKKTKWGGGTVAAMTENYAAFAYLAASVCFIMALRGLSSPVTSRQGNFFGIPGMAIAMATPLALPEARKGGVEGQR